MVRRGGSAAEVRSLAGECFPTLRSEEPSSRMRVSARPGLPRSRAPLPRSPSAHHHRPALRVRPGATVGAPNVALQPTCGMPSFAHAEVAV
jgi:hypothetical protein